MKKVVSWLQENYKLIIPISLLVVIFISFLVYYKIMISNNYHVDKDVSVYQYFNNQKYNYVAVVSKNKKGVVERLTLRSTIISDDNGVKEIIPNSTLTNNPYYHFKTPEKYRADLEICLTLDVDVKEFEEYIVDKMLKQDGILENPKPAVYSKGTAFDESQLKVSFWVKDFNSKDKYKLIITNEIRKFIKMGEK